MKRVYLKRYKIKLLNTFFLVWGLAILEVIFAGVFLYVGGWDFIIGASFGYVISTLNTIVVKF
jgi:hypothetical protein